MSMIDRTREVELYREGETSKTRSRMNGQHIIAVMSGVMRGMMTTPPLNLRMLKWETKVGIGLENDLYLKN